MAQEQSSNKNQLLVLITVAAFLIAGLFFWQQKKQTSIGLNTPLVNKNSQADALTKADDSVVEGTIETMPAIDFKDLDKKGKLTDLMDQRKSELGMEKSFDMIVESDESFTIGETAVSMRDIIEKSSLKNQEVFEEQIRETGEIKPEKKSKFGIYVIQPGDNIWNVHFTIIQEFYEAKGIKVAMTADEPLKNGGSSGVGKLLKFSETMVIIYNLKEESVDIDINVLEPLSKIVVYNMKELFDLLEEIDYDNVDQIRFDGETVWIPAKRP